MYMYINIRSCGQLFSIGLDLVADCFLMLEVMLFFFSFGNFFFPLTFQNIDCEFFEVLICRNNSLSKHNFFFASLHTKW